MTCNKAEFWDELTVLNDGLRAREPPMNGCHVQRSLSIFTLKQSTINKVTLYVELKQGVLWIVISAVRPAACRERQHFFLTLMLTSAPLHTRSSKHRAPWREAAVKCSGAKPFSFTWFTLAPHSMSSFTTTSCPL